ncbi:MAG: hypothetical protein QNK37_11400 [Acidobacteriota bacterium]|nr:hypothetical protein [Acidobacteriota bacterium]
MTTAVKGCENQSDTTVSIVNTENPGDSRTVFPHSSDSEVYAWISQHKDKPLNAQTMNGLCQIWDEEWKIYGQWYGESKLEILVDNIPSSPMDYLMKVDAKGDIQLSQLEPKTES